MFFKLYVQRHAMFSLILVISHGVAPVLSYGVISSADRDLICDKSIPYAERSGTIRWLHIPKTGTQFTQTAFRHGCDVPDDYEVPEDQHVEIWFAKKFPGKRCPRMMDGTPNTHKPVGGREKSRLSAFVGMMREPISRHCSAATMFSKRENRQHGHCILDCNLENSGCTGRVRGGGFNTKKVTAWLNGTLVRPTNCPRLSRKKTEDYIKDPSVQGCAAKMLNGLPCNANVTLPDDLALRAASRLDAFAFVGLVEEWDLSICLFHRLFGGSPSPQEFNVFGSNSRSKTLCTDKVLQGNRDPADELVYEHARAHFWNSVQRVIQDLRAKSRESLSERDSSVRNLRR
jgi:hypothetical protein